jgi:prepilin-type N-terminal cleavage/methylation domain-containing protein
VQGRVPTGVFSSTLRPEERPVLAGDEDVHKSSTARGFTLLEAAVVMAIAAILAWLALSNIWRLKARANLAGTAAELQALLYQARQTAMGDAKPVAVLFYPSQTQTVRGVTSTGYVVVYEDACADFFTAAPSCGQKFSSYEPDTLKAGGDAFAQGVVVDTLWLPAGILVGPEKGMGEGAKLVAPLDQVPVDLACSFCGSTAGAVRFDAQGRATFYSLSGTAQSGPLKDQGGYSVSLGFDPIISPMPGQRTLVILSGSGAVYTIVGG